MVSNYGKEIVLTRTQLRAGQLQAGLVRAYEHIIQNHPNNPDRVIAWVMDLMTDQYELGWSDAKSGKKAEEFMYPREPE